METATHVGALARLGHALDDLTGLVLAVDPGIVCPGTNGSACGCGCQ